MKRFFCIVLSTVISTFAFAQGITKNGKITTDGSTYINKNGAVGLSTGVDKYGKIVIASPLPIVTTSAISAIIGTKSTSGGNVISSGSSNVTERGICWSAFSSPNITGQGTVLPDGTLTGNGAGSFTSNLIELMPNSIYYVRAYATNSLGTAYGNEVSFTTTSITVGDSYQGGIVFYSDGAGHGLIAATSNQSTSAYWVDAVGICDNYSVDIYDDWYLPSSSETATMYSKKNIIGGFGNNRYWCSDLYPGDTNQAYLRYFSDGSLHASFKSSSWPSTPYYVRAIRAF